MLRPLTTLGLVGLAFGSFGCVGSIDQAGGSSPTNPSGSGPGGRIPGEPGSGPPTGPGAGVSPGGLPSDADSVPGPAPLRRLTRFEYENTVRDLLGLTTVPKKGIAGFSADQESASSGYVRGGAVTAAPDARVLMQAAEELAGAALQQVSSLLPCSPLPTAAAEQDACADKFVASFGRRAYRRPLTDAEVKDLRDLYRAQRTPEAGADFQQAVGNVITAMLQSPYFLYRWEVGAAAPIKDGLLVRFNQHETASRLSYLIWASMPDDKLFEAADTGKLATADQVAAQARRLLADMPKDPSLTDVYTPEVAQAMLRETREFVASVFQGPKADGKLETLMTAQASFANAALAKIYGLPNVTGADLKPVSYNPAERAGLFTQGTFLSMKADAIDSHPIKRGDTMLNKVLCIPLEVPASIMVPPLPEPQPGQTTRERVSIHSEAACATCHKLIDPIGFAFENYDAIARYRATEEGKPVDASGVFPLGSGALTFKNAVELLPQLARTPEARDCMVTQWWRYALRRNEAQTEEPSMKLVREAFAQSGYDMRELLVAFTRTRAFSHRKPSLDEVLP
jgi:hypothetical protein